MKNVCAAVMLSFVTCHCFRVIRVKASTIKTRVRNAGSGGWGGGGGNLVEAYLILYRED